MSLQETILKPAVKLNSGGVRRFVTGDGKIAITQITTFCPDEIGPGPTHLYLIESDALVLVDAGIPTQLAKAFFYHWRNQRIPSEVESLSANHSELEFLDAMGLVGRSVEDIDLLVFSHGHLDHFLMAPAILSRGRPSVSIHTLDTPQTCNPWGLLHMWLSGQQRMKPTGMPEPWSAQNLVSDDALRGFSLESLGAAIKVDAPIFTEGHLNLGGSPVRNIDVKHLPGHSPGSIGLVVGKGPGKALICGDVLLNPITPHPDDLLTYLRTLEKLETLEDIALVLPAHGRVIPDLKARVQFLKEHHQRRLKRTFDACLKPCTVWDISTTEGYFDTYVDPGKFNFLAGQEALVHMELLNMVHGLRRVDVKDQVHYFQSSQEPFDQVYARIMELVAGSNSVPNMRY